MARAKHLIELQCIRRVPRGGRLGGVARGELWELTGEQEEEEQRRRRGGGAVEEDEEERGQILELKRTLRLQTKKAEGTGGGGGGGALHEQTSTEKHKVTTGNVNRT